jgi:hypothetical protein
MFNLDLLNWFGNFINFLIFAYLALNIINTKCFNTFQMSLSLIGLLASIFIQMISMLIKNYMIKRG